MLQIKRAFRQNFWCLEPIMSHELAQNYIVCILLIVLFTTAIICFISFVLVLLQCHVIEMVVFRKQLWVLASSPVLFEVFVAEI